MSDIGDVVNGLSGTGGGIVLSALVLVGVYSVFRQTFGVLFNRIFDQSEKYIESVFENMKQITLDIKEVRADINQIKTKIGERE